MPSIVTASQLRTVLGVSVSLYSDAYLDEIINTSENVILPMLVANTSAINSYKLESNVAYFYTQRSHHFVAGQSVIVTGLPAPFTATHTVITATEYSFTAALTSANVTLREIIPMGMATLSGYSADAFRGRASPPGQRHRRHDHLLRQLADPHLRLVRQFPVY